MPALIVVLSPTIWYVEIRSQRYWHISKALCFVWQVCEGVLAARQVQEWKTKDQSEETHIESGL
jgi:hypothetical protein